MNMRKGIASIALIAYLFLAIFSLFSTHQHGVSADGCPFMVGQQSICQRDGTLHLEAWKGITTTMFPIFTLLFFISTLFVFVFLWYLSPPRFGIFRQQTNLFFLLLYQRLFSEGILHPKAP
jgi:hypothetical protein